MALLARWLTRPPIAWSVVLFTLLIATVAGAMSLRVGQDDDVLAFLPETDPDVATFFEINRRFGGLEVALLGIEGDVMEPEFFGRLQRLTQALDESPRIDFALSLANVDDFVPSNAGGIEADRLVRTMPTDPTARAAMAAKIRSRDLVVGQLVSHALDSVLVLVFPSADTDPRAFADEIRAAANKFMPGSTLHFGGAPFVSSYVYDTTQRDLSKLLPWALAAIIALVLIGFRDVIGAVVVLVSTGTGIAVSMATMFVFDVPHNIVLSSMPVIAFSVGSAYGLHVLARYQRLARSRPGPEALRDTLVSVGPTVVTAGLTTVSGLLSFLAMDIRPMQTFGLFTALGVFVALVAALTFVPATIVVFGYRRSLEPPRSRSWLAPVVAAISRHRAAFGAGLAVVALVFGWFVGRVDTRMDLTAFFADDSPPARADRFLLDAFGGSQFLQIHVRGDFTDPSTLWTLVHLADRIESIDDVSAVQHIGQVVAQLDLAMEGVRRIPDSPEKVRLLYRFLAGRPAIGQLVSNERNEAVLHAKIARSDVDTVERVLAQVEDIVRSARAATANEILDARLEVLTKRVGGQVNESHARVRALELPQTDDTVVIDSLVRFLGSDEAIVELAEGDARAVARAMVSSSTAPGGRVLAALDGVEVEGEIADRSLADDLVRSLKTPLAEARARLANETRADRLASVFSVDGADPRWRSHVVGALALLDTNVERRDLVMRVSGLPVLHRGLSRSTVRNQYTSLFLALISVIVVLTVAYRSLRFGLVAAAPTVVTLVVVYGGMGMLGVHLDIGTAMLASLIIGAGVDYAVHLVSAWRVTKDLEQAVASTSTSIWTNALMVAAGFFILTLGEARTLQNVGGLTAAAMLTAAVATFVCIPVLGRRMFES